MLLVLYSIIVTTVKCIVVGFVCQYPFLKIKNKGQHPSFQVFYELATLFKISVDHFFFPDAIIVKSTRRRQLDDLLDGLDDNDLIIMEGTAKGISEAKQAGKQ